MKIQIDQSNKDLLKVMTAMTIGGALFILMGVYAVPARNGARRMNGVKQIKHQPATQKMPAKTVMFPVQHTR